jgi:signal transduction histidine kinase/transcriptional regulator with GAF, ATPase, and Fis domain
MEQALIKLKNVIAPVMLSNNLKKMMSIFLNNVCDFMGADYGIFVYCSDDLMLYNIELLGLEFKSPAELKNSIEENDLEKLSNEYELQQMLLNECNVIKSRKEFFKRKSDLEAFFDKNKEETFIFHKFFKEKFSTCLAIPLLLSDKLVGELTVGYRKDTEINELKKVQFKIMADFATIAVKNVDKLGQLQASIELLKNFHEIINKKDIDVSELLSPIVKQVIMAVKASGGHIRILGHNNRSGKKEIATLVGGFGDYYEWSKVNKNSIILSDNEEIMRAFYDDRVLVKERDDILNTPIFFMSDMRDDLSKEILNNYWKKVKYAAWFPIVWKIGNDSEALGYFSIQGEHKSLISAAMITILESIVKNISYILNNTRSELEKNRLFNANKNKYDQLMRLVKLIKRKGEFGRYKTDVVNAAQICLSSESSSIFLYNKSERYLERISVHPEKYFEPEKECETYRDIDNERGITGQVFRCTEENMDHILLNNEEEILSGGIQKHIEWYKSLPSWEYYKEFSKCPIHHILVVPIYGTNGKVFGALRAINKRSVEYTEENPVLDTFGFNADDVQFVSTIASIVSQAMSNEFKSEKLRLLHEVSTFMSNNLDLKKISNKLLDAIVYDLKYSAALVELFRDNDFDLVTYKNFENEIPKILKIKNMSQPYWEVINSGEILEIEDILDKNVTEKISNITFFIKEKVRSICYVPIKNKENECIGLITVCMRHNPYKFFNYEKEILSTLATTFSISLQNIKSLEQAHKSKDRLKDIVDTLREIHFWDSVADVVAACFSDILSIFGAEEGAFYSCKKIISEDNEKVYDIRKLYNIGLERVVNVPIWELNKFLSMEKSMVFKDDQDARYGDYKTKEILFKISFESEILGIVFMVIKNNENNSLPETDIEMLIEVISKQLSIAIKNIDLKMERKKLDLALPAIASNQLASGIVHDILQNSKTCSLTLEILRDGEYSYERTREEIRNAENILFSIRHLADRYLHLKDNFSSETLGVEKRPNSINKTLDLVLRENNALIKERLAVIKTQYSKDLKSRNVHFDRNFIKFALSNLINNSLKWIPRNGEIEITTKMEENFATILISDNGSGIKFEHKDKIFDAFFTQDEKKGYGLGLTLSKYIIENLHKGKIAVTKLNDPTRFSVKLPITR